MNTVDTHPASNQQDQDGVFASLNGLIQMRAAANLVDFNSGVKSQSLIDGAYLSHRRGRGMEFAEVRPYQAGDDIRTIDWRVTARTQETYTKLFQEEKERPVYVVVDQRSPMFFGSKTQFKSFLAAELAAILAWGTFRNNDSLGAMIFGNHSQHDMRPKRGKRATLRFLNILAEYNQQLGQKNPLEKGTSAEQAQTLASIFQELRRVARPGSTIFIISDFHDFDASCEKDVSTLSRHCDIELLHLFDPLEQALPKNARLTVTDGEQRRVLDTHNAEVGKSYSKNWQSFTQTLAHSATKARVQLNPLSTTLAAEKHITQLFHSNKKGRATR